MRMRRMAYAFVVSMRQSQLLSRQSISYGPHRQKSDFWSFRPDNVQTSLFSYKYYNTDIMYAILSRGCKKGADRTMRMHRLVSALVGRTRKIQGPSGPTHKTHFVEIGPFGHLLLNALK